MSGTIPATPLDTALHGGLLIEASAGTGKTYALTTLAARAVVELRLAIDRLLIVTFTIAATGELRERLRRTLRLALSALQSGQASDPQARSLLRRWQECVDVAEATALLERAVRDLDRANVMTIHGLCQRLLAEFAFEGGVPFGFAVSGDDAAAVGAAVRHYWRRHIATAPVPLIDHAANGKFTLAAATQWVQEHHAKPGLDVRGDGAASRTLAASSHANWQAAFAETRNAWREHGEELLHTLDTLVWHRNHERKIMRVRDAATAAFANDDPSALPLQEAGYLGGESLRRVLKKGQRLPENPLFARFDRLGGASAKLETLAGLWLQQQRRNILEEVRSTLRQEAWRNRQLSFNDLLTETARALFEPSGDALARRVRERYPLALIDEFQDTDSLQARIFERIYANAGHGREDAGIGLVVVGDPKQSIYGFRGADVFAYLRGTSGAGGAQARLATPLGCAGEANAHSETTSNAAVRRLRLTANHRSAPPLVQAVNVVFGRSNPFLLPDIGYDNVHPAKQRGAALRIEGDAIHPAPLQFRLRVKGEGESLSKEMFQPIAARCAAAEIAQLLQSGDRGAVRIGDAGVSGGDIAVLVRTAQQGQAVAQELRARGVQSVEMGGVSVFDSTEAQQLHRLLAALAARETDPGRCRGALAGDLFGLDVHRLAQLADDDRIWATWQERIRAWRGIWQQSGAATLIRRLLFTAPTDGATHLLRHPHGPRRLTNTLHLADLLQQAETAERLSPTGLVEWLAKHRAGLGRVDDNAAQLRLESDERLVKIVTVHRSKGLEFPIVFCPFAWYRRNPRKGVTAGYHDRNTAGFPEVLDLAPTDAAYDLEHVEEQSEELRLLYVALTRAKYRCVVTWAQASGAEHAPLAWLLHGSQLPDVPAQQARIDNARHVKKLGAEAWRQQVAALAEEHPEAIGVSELIAAPAAFRRNADAQPALAARRFERPLLRLRQMTSYSALEADAGAAVSATEHAQVERPDHDQREEAVLAVQDPEPLAATAPTALPAAAIELATPDFPRGRRAGDCLHELFEASVKQEANWRNAAPDALAKRGMVVELAANACLLVENARQTPLTAPADGTALRIADLDRAVAEMEFHIPVHGLNRAKLGECLAHYGYGNPFRTGEDVTGFLRGYIDLVAEHEGRWYVLDYKSNWLGERVDAYSPAALAEAMQRGGYHLQYLLYLTALHRYLRWRLDDYAYDRHVGGACYLFVRGMRPERPGHSVFRARPGRACIEAIDACLSGGAQSAS